MVKKPSAGAVMGTMLVVRVVPAGTWYKCRGIDAPAKDKL